MLLYVVAAQLVPVIHKASADSASTGHCSGGSCEICKVSATPLIRSETGPALDSVLTPVMVVRLLQDVDILHAFTMTVRSRGAPLA